MSFDVFLASFRDGEKAAADAAAARGVLERVKYEHQSEFNSYDIQFADGSHVELYAEGLHGDAVKFDGGMFAVGGFSNAVGDFIFEFARAAGCVIIPASEFACVIIPREDLAVHLPGEFERKFKKILVASGGEVLAAFGGGYEKWRAYRDQIVREGGNGA